MSKFSFPVVSVLSLCVATPAFSQESISEQSFEERHSAAVSGVNAKVSFGYSYIDTGADDNFDFRPLPNAIDQANDVNFEFPRENEFQGGFVQGSITFPLSETVGFQVDGLYSRQSSNLDLDFNVFGAGGHLFIRDPEKGLLGVYGQYLDYGDYAQSYQIGAEAQIYHENISLELFAGADNLEVVTQSNVLVFNPNISNPGIYNPGIFNPSIFDERTVETSIEDDFFTFEAIAALYPTENIRIFAGIGHGFEETSFLTGLEWKPSDKVASNLFVDAQIGEDVSAVRAGVRFSFSEDNKTLIRQHREDHLQNRLLNNSASLARCMDNFVINSFIDPAIGPITITPVAPNPAGGTIPIDITFEPKTSLDGCDIRLNQ